MPKVVKPMAMMQQKQACPATRTKQQECSFLFRHIRNMVRILLAIPNIPNRDVTMPQNKNSPQAAKSARTSVVFTMSSNISSGFYLTPPVGQRAVEDEAGGRAQSEVLSRGLFRISNPCYCVRSSNKTSHLRQEYCLEQHPKTLLAVCVS